MPYPVDWDRVRVLDGEGPFQEGAILADSCGEMGGCGDGETCGLAAGRGQETRAQRDDAAGRGQETRAQRDDAGGRGQETRAQRATRAERATGAERRFVTFVNPVLEKGVCPFVRIAQELGRRRPEIPFLVVESRGDRRTLSALGLGRDGAVNVQFLPNTNDPREFYAWTRIIVMPSLWWENQPLVAIEAMINGIPVIGSDRGGIPEALGECGFVLPLPAH